MKLIPGFSYTKIILIWTLLLILGVGGFFAWTEYLQGTKETVTYQEELAEGGEYVDTEYDGIDPSELIDNPITGESEKEALRAGQNTSNSPENTGDNFNILVLGIDRRHGEQNNWRTDVIQLITLSPDRSKAVITHVPRDVWADTYKINAIYNLQGPDAMKDHIERVTGQRPDRIIRVDFDAFVWAIDAVGGLTIDVPVSFVDSSYPNDRKGVEEVITVEFETGSQTMDGEKALIYARSRKGTNGQGSDYARGARQQQIMEAIIDDYFNPSNLFQPKTAETLYKLATQKMYTDMTLKDTKILYDVLTNHENIEIYNIGLSTTNYLTTPADRSNYGGAWTLIAKNDDYTPIHREIDAYIAGVTPDSLSGDVQGITTKATDLESDGIKPIQ